MKRLLVAAILALGLAVVPLAGCGKKPPSPAPIINPLVGTGIQDLVSKSGDVAITSDGSHAWVFKSKKMNKDGSGKYLFDLLYDAKGAKHQDIPVTAYTAPDGTITRFDFDN